MSPAISERDTLPGRVLLNSITVVGRLGAGAVSDVYLARQMSVGNRNVAVKVLKKVICASQDEEAQIHRERFLYEAQLLCLLKGSCFVRVIEAGTVRDDVDRPFIVMEYLAGETLAARIEKQGPLPFPAALHLALALADALDELHVLKVIYRDLSPGNVILDEKGSGGIIPRLFDFSHAAVLGVGQMDPQGCAGKLLAGTIPYCAPELARGNAAEESDVYSLAALLYFAVAGVPHLELPMAGWREYLAALSKERRIPARPLRSRIPAVPAAVDEALERALLAAPEARYPTVSEFATALAKAVVLSPKLLSLSGWESLQHLATRLLLRH
jgi:serine/threonine protein kinase